ncbi:MAG: hypothetical protein IKB34_00465 [Clostridia bacterium]|nr:hypothetical protein [Clostridia bacterium]
MQKILKMIATCVLLSFMTCFLGVGFAQVSDTLTVNGAVEYEHRYPVYIMAVARAGGNSNSNVLTEDPIYVGPYMDASISLAAYQSYGQTSSVGSYIVLSVTVYNSTAKDYAYQNTIGANDIDNLTVGVYTNSSCTTALSSSNGIVKGNQALTFYVRLSHKLRSTVTYTPKMTFNFTMDITEEDVENITKTASDNFAEVLNVESSYNALTQSMDNNYDGERDWTASFIGNAAGATDEDKETLDELFDEVLSINLDGVPVNVTCIIKRENLDGDTTTGDSYTVGGTTYAGCEMTLYMTTAALGELSYDDYPTVYAIVFTKFANSDDWEQIGEDMYEGTAQVVGYSGGTTSGSFDTGSWTSSQRYHGVWAGNKLSTIIKRALS